MPLLIFLAIATIVLSTYLALQTRRPFWRRAGSAYVVLAGVNLAMALNFLVVAQPLRTITITLLLIATLFLLPVCLLALWRGANERGDEPD